jgi:hypothetical protein
LNAAAAMRYSLRIVRVCLFRVHNGVLLSVSCTSLTLRVCWWRDLFVVQKLQARLESLLSVTRRDYGPAFWPAIEVKVQEAIQP